MKYITFMYNDKMNVGIMSDDLKSVDITEYTDMTEMIKNSDYNPKIIGKADFDKIKLCSPIPEPYQDIICVGVNYAAHAEESSSFKKENLQNLEYPVFFSKRVNYAIGSGDFIDSHSDINDSLDYECELAVVIDKEAKKISESEVYDHIFGYTILNDISSRNLQNRHKQWYIGKSLDGFTSIGPWIVSKDEIEYLPRLDVKCYVNDELRQNSNTSIQLFDIGRIVSELSQGITLKPGTIISTGTPSGVGMGFNPPKYLKQGDIVRCEIEKIGVLKNIVK